MASQTAFAHIVHSDDVLGGEARIDGHRIRVRDIVAARDLGGMTPEEIAVNVYPNLTLGQVYSALAYYEDHRQEIDRAASEETAFVARFLQEQSGIIHDARPSGE